MFTDRTLYSALAGHCGLGRAFHVPVSAIADRSLTPLRVLQRLLWRMLISRRDPRLPPVNRA